MGWNAAPRREAPQEDYSTGLGRLNVGTSQFLRSPSAPERSQLSRFGQSCRIDPPSVRHTEAQTRRPRRNPLSARAVFLRRAQKRPCTGTCGVPMQGQFWISRRLCRTPNLAPSRQAVWSKQLTRYSRTAVGVLRFSDGGDGLLVLFQLGLFAQNGVHQRPMNLDVSVVADEAELAKLVHEMTDAGTGGADYLG
jgi:hypothetical protein